MSSFGSSLKGLAVVAGSAFAAIGVGSFLKGSVQAATDLNETINKSTTIFGDSAGEIDDWARGAAKSFGQSRKQALDAAAGFGNMFQQLGIGGKTAVTMSKQMVELASDFASFHNVDITEVLEAQSAAFRGEYDSVQRFVPTITAASVEQKALALGLAGSTKELTAQDKAIATQALLLEGAGAAMGDFDRTAQSLANQQRILGALWEEAKAQIGQALLPAVTSVVKFLVSSGIPAFLGLAGGVQAFIAALADGRDDITSSGFAGAMEGIGVTIRNMVDEAVGGIRAMVTAFRDGGDDITSSGFAGALEAAGVHARNLFDLIRNNQDAILTVVSSLTAFAGTLLAIQKGAAAISTVQSVLTAIGPAIGALAAAAVAAPVVLLVAGIVAVGVAAFVAYKKFKPFRDVVDAVGRVIRDVAVAAFEWLRDNLPKVGAAAETAFGAFRGAIDTVVAAFQRFFAFLSTVFNTVVTALTPLAQWFQANVVSTFNAGLELLVAAFQRAFGFISVGFSTLVALAQPWIEALIATVNNMWTVISAVFQAVGVIVAAQVSFWVGLFQTFVGIMGPLWSGLWEYIKIIVVTAFELVKNNIETVLGIIRGIFQVLTGLIQGDWGKMWEGIRTIATSVFEGVRGFIDAIWNAIKGIFANAIDTVQNTVSNGFSLILIFVAGIPGRIASALGDLGGILVRAGEDLIRGLLQGIRNMAGAAADAAKSVVSGAVNAAKSALGIGSPSKVFMEIGEFSIQGFVEGVARSTPAAVSQIGRFAGAVSSPGLRLTPSLGSLTAGGAGAVGAGGVVVNIHQPMNPRTVSEEIGWALRTGGR